MTGMNGLLHVLTLRCEAASALSSQELDEPLSRLDRTALWCHLLACRSCRRFRKQLRWIRAASAAIAGSPPETAGTRDFPGRRRSHRPRDPRGQRGTGRRGQSGRLIEITSYPRLDRRRRPG